MADFTTTHGSIPPYVRFTLKGADKLPFDWEGEDCVFLMRRGERGDLVALECTPTDPENGEGEIRFTDEMYEDFAPGLYQGQFWVDPEGDAPKAFPSDEYYTIEFLAPIGPVVPSP